MCGQTVYLDSLELSSQKDKNVRGLNRLVFCVYGVYVTCSLIHVLLSQGQSKPGKGKDDTAVMQIFLAVTLPFFFIHSLIFIFFFLGPVFFSCTCVHGRVEQFVKQYLKLFSKLESV